MICTPNTGHLAENIILAAWSASVPAAWAVLPLDTGFSSAKRFSTAWHSLNYKLLTASPWVIDESPEAKPKTPGHDKGFHGLR